MKGARPLQWIWNWLGQGSMGEDYTVLPAVQPVCVIDGLELPLQKGQYSFTANLAVGAVNTNLPNASSADKKSRLWINLEVQRSNVVLGTDSYKLIRSITAMGPAAREVWQQANGLVGAGIWQPVISGKMVVATTAAGGPPMELNGVRPVLVPKDEILIFQANAAAAVGNFTLIGLYVDVPDSAPLPAAFYF